MIKTLLLTDVVNSTALTEELGDESMSKIWIEHDHIARDLLNKHNGKEADRTDGFLMLFDSPNDACLYAVDLHEAFQNLSEKESIDFKARIGIHRGKIILIETSEELIASGVMHLEVEGIAKPVTARMMSIADGGQTLMSVEAYDALDDSDLRFISHGHWRMKGITEPVQLFEVGDETTNFHPPTDYEKIYRVNLVDEIWVPVKETRNNLTRERNKFIGRTRDLHLLSEILNDSETQLITVLGSGGIGKTRLSKQFARIWMGNYPGGVWFCDLQEAWTLEGISVAVAAAIDVPLAKGDPVIQLGNVIMNRGKCLVILDNFEQVAEYASKTLGHWLDRAPQAKFLITSRSLLNLPGEQTMILEPLPVDTDSVLLFETRAKERNPSFQITDKNRDDVRFIAETLDGIPLAIELAAARISVLQPRQIRERLSKRFKLLTGNKRVAERQKTLHATLEWSWDLLEEWERSALAQCSVFEGGFTLDAAEEIIDLSAFENAPIVMDTIQSLVDRSLLNSKVKRNDVNESWFAMYASIQEYSAKKLPTAGEFNGSGIQGEKACRQRHIKYFADFGTDKSIEALHRHGGVEKIKTLVNDLDNFVVALRRSITMEDDSNAALLLSATWQVLKRTGCRDIIKAPAESILKMNGINQTSRLRTYHVLAEFAIDNTEVDAHTWIEKGIETARGTGNKRLERDFMDKKANYLSRIKGQYKQARQISEENLKAAQEANNNFAEVNSLSIIAFSFAIQGRYEESHEYEEKTLLLARKIGDMRRECQSLANLGVIFFHQYSDYIKAREYFNQALDIATEIGHKFEECRCIGNIGNTYMAKGYFNISRKYHEKALSMARDLGSSQSEAFWLENIAIGLSHNGKYSLARKLLENAVSISKENQTLKSEMLFREALAIVLIKLGEHDLALQHCEKIMAVALETKDRQLECYSDRVLASIFMDKGEYGKARERYEKALSIAREIKMNYEEYRMIRNLGTISSKQGNFKEAMQHFELAEKISSNLNSDIDLVHLMTAWAEAAILASDYKVAGKKLAAAIELTSKLELDPDSDINKGIEKVEKMFEVLVN